MPRPNDEESRIKRHSSAAYSNYVENVNMKLMKNCQKMVDASVRMQCNHCYQVYLTTDFYDHIKDVYGGDCS